MPDPGSDPAYVFSVTGEMGVGDPPDPYFHVSFTAFGTLMCRACLTFYGHIKGMKAR